MNNLKTGILLTLLTLLLVFLGSALGGQQGAIIAFGFAVIMNGSAYWFSDRVVLRMYKAQEVSETQSPELYGVVSDLAQRARIPMPKVYLIPSPALNAFATGRNPEHAAVAITEGLLGTLDRHELAGVVAHELSHVKHRDILIGTLAATIAGAISMLASMAQWGAMFGGFSRGGDSRGGQHLRGAHRFDRGGVRRVAGADGDLALARIPGRRRRGAAAWRPHGPHLGIAQARAGGAARAPGRQPRHRASLHRESAERRPHEQVLQHASPHRGAHPSAPGDDRVATSLASLTPPTPRRVPVRSHGTHSTASTGIAPSPTSRCMPRSATGTSPGASAPSPPSLRTARCACAGASMRC